LACVIAFALSVIPFCASCNVPAVISKLTIAFASNECATCEYVFGFAVSSEMQLSTALSTVNVLHVLAVTFTISLVTVCPFNCCSIVNKYGNDDGKMLQSFTIIDVELDEIALTKYETMLLAVLYHINVIFLVLYYVKLFNHIPQCICFVYCQNALIWLV
jgi:hypothetical protein